MGHPFQYFFLGMFVIFLVTIYRTKPGITEVIEAANSIEQNPMAIIVLVIGVIVLFHGDGKNDNAASIIIGYAGGLLQNQIKNAIKNSPGGTSTLTMTQTTPEASETPEVKP